MASISIQMAPSVKAPCSDPSCNDCVERRLLLDLRERDGISFRRLYLSYSASLLGIILRVVPAREIAEDILQDTFIKIWKSLDTYDPQKARLFTWMARMARNSAIDYKRGKSFAKSVLNEDMDSAFSQVERFHQVHESIDTIGVRELVHQLPPSQQEVLSLVYFQGYTQAEVSDELQMPLGTVKSKIRLAVKALRICFA